MLQKLHRLVLGVCVLIAGSAPSKAETGSVEIVKAEARLFQKLTQAPASTVNRGFVQLVTPPEGKLFLVVWLNVKLKPAKTPDGDDVVKVEEQAIHLTPAGQVPVRAIGKCTRDGRFYPGASEFYFSGEPDTETIALEPVFLVPAKAKSFDLNYGSARQAITVTEPVAPTIQRSASASFELEETEVLDKLTTTEEIGPFDQRQGEISRHVEAPADKYLVVHMIVKPKTANAQTTFQFSSEDIGLLYGSQVYTPPIGYIAGDEFTPFSRTYFSLQDAGGEFPAVEVAIVYPLPDKVSKFKVLYLLEPVAEGTVGK